MNFDEMASRDLANHLGLNRFSLFENAGYDNKSSPIVVTRSNNNI